MGSCFCFQLDPSLQVLTYFGKLYLLCDGVKSNCYAQISNLAGEKISFVGI